MWTSAVCSSYVTASSWTLCTKTAQLGAVHLNFFHLPSQSSHNSSLSTPLGMTKRIASLAPGKSSSPVNKLLFRSLTLINSGTKRGRWDPQGPRVPPSGNRRTWKSFTTPVTSHPSWYHLFTHFPLYSSLFFLSPNTFLLLIYKIFIIHRYIQLIFFLLIFLEATCQ